MTTSTFDKSRQTTLDNDRKWAAVMSRSDGETFVYAVKTTGIFCRPTCASRRPLRRNVAFFDLPRDAIAAGYRACVRCRPEAINDDREILRAAIQSACDQLSRSKSNADIASIARSVGISAARFGRKFKSAIGLTPTQFAAARRNERVKASLRANRGVAAAIYDAGFNSAGRFYEQADGNLGMTPTAYRDGGRGAVLTLAIAPCSLGLVAVAASARGICAIHLGDDREHLEHSIKRELPNAIFERDHRSMHNSMRDWLIAVVQQVDSPADKFDLPLDIRATAFQAKVWTALRGIRLGDTSTYSAIARTIGQPSAVRAVARACATNPVSIIVPCHRVIGRSGSLTGYRWGLKRKAALLLVEGAALGDNR